MQSLKGHLLLASSKLLDPNFARSVVLLVQHDENGALGLIVNRPLEISVQQACQEALDITCAVDSPLHQGGPCDGPLMVVHTQEISSQIEVMPHVHFTTDRGHVESLLLNGDVTMKCFVGYAGWTGGQLEMEMEIGSWVTLPAEKDHIFEESGEELWNKLIARATLGQWIDPDRIPEDPNVN